MFNHEIVDALKMNVEIIALAFLGVMFIIWLVLRPIRLWYWQRSEEVKLLKSIDEKLSQKSDFEMEREIQSTSEPPENGDITEIKTADASTAKEAVCEKIDDKAARAGRVYTEEELYEIIKF